ncbi:hypothetical protein D3C80_1294320 [compost metagenome]
MRHVAQLGRRAADAAGEHLLLGGDVEQRVLDLHAATVGYHAAGEHVLGAQRLPVTVDDLAGLARQADHVLARDRLEVAGVAQVLADDLGHVLGQHGAALRAERHHGNRDGAIGTAGNHQRVGRFRHTGEQRQAQ